MLIIFGIALVAWFAWNGLMELQRPLRPLPFRSFDIGRKVGVTIQTVITISIVLALVLAVAG